MQNPVINQIKGAVFRSVLASPDAILHSLVGKPIVRRGHALDAQVQLGIVLNKLSGNKPSHLLPLEQARYAMDEITEQIGGDLAPIGSFEDREIGGCPVRIYRPVGAAASGNPAIVYYHGGGYCIGSLESHHACCWELCARADCVVISVDYRLAPEHPFPAAVDDGTRVFRAVAAEAEALGLDPARIAVGGDSAGGNLSAVCCHDTRQDERRPCYQLLIYPGTDMTMSFPSIEEMGEGFILEADTIAWFKRQYLAGTDPRDPRASPLFQESFEGLPPALVITAGFDPLCDEGIAYADKLRAAGVPTEHHHHPSLFHGFWNTVNVMRTAGEAFDDAVAALRAAFRG